MYTPTWPMLRSHVYSYLADVTVTCILLHGRCYGHMYTPTWPMLRSHVQLYIYSYLADVKEDLEGVGTPGDCGGLAVQDNHHHLTDLTGLLIMRNMWLLCSINIIFLYARFTLYSSSSCCFLIYRSSWSSCLPYTV